MRYETRDVDTKEPENRDLLVGCGYHSRIDWRGKILALEGQVEENRKEKSQKSEGDM